MNSTNGKNGTEMINHLPKNMTPWAKAMKMSEPDPLTPVRAVLTMMTTIAITNSRAIEPTHDASAIVLRCKRNQNRYRITKSCKYFVCPGSRRSVNDYLCAAFFFNLYKKYTDYTIFLFYVSL